MSELHFPSGISVRRAMKLRLCAMLTVGLVSVGSCTRALQTGSDAKEAEAQGENMKPMADEGQKASVAMREENDEADNLTAPVAPLVGESKKATARGVSPQRPFAKKQASSSSVSQDYFLEVNDLDICGFDSGLGNSGEKEAPKSIGFVIETARSRLKDMRSKWAAVDTDVFRKSLVERQAAYKSAAESAEMAVRYYAMAQSMDGERDSDGNGLFLRVNDRISLAIEAELARLHCLRIMGLGDPNVLNVPTRNKLWERALLYWSVLDDSDLDWRGVEMVSNTARLFAAALDTLTVIDSQNQVVFNKLLGEARDGVLKLVPKKAGQGEWVYAEQVSRLISSKGTAYDAFRRMASTIDATEMATYAATMVGACNDVAMRPESEWNRDLREWRKDVIVECCKMAAAVGKSSAVVGVDRKTTACPK